MSRITDYGFLFQSMSGTTGSTNFANTFKVSSLSSRETLSMLNAAGINTNSKQYKAAVNRMSASAGAGVAYTNPQAIKNLMQSYDEDGDYISPSSGLAGLTVTADNISEKHRIISISESSREEMFELTKSEFLRNNGLQNGDTTRRGEVYTNLYKKTAKSDRLAAGNTLRQYETAYRQAFIAAAQAADPEWELGKPVSYSALKNVTRESVEATLTQSGNTLVTKTNSIDVSV